MYRSDSNVQLQRHAAVCTNAVTLLFYVLVRCCVLVASVTSVISWYCRNSCTVLLLQFTGSD
jgi:hypothetical protein